MGRGDGPNRDQYSTEFITRAESMTEVPLRNGKWYLVTEDMEWPSVTMYIRG